MITKIVTWFVRSSADPTKISLTVRGALVSFITIVTIWAGLAGVQLPSEMITEWVEAIVVFVQSTVLTVSAAITAWGLFRKIWWSLSGDNRVMTEHSAFKE